MNAVGGNIKSLRVRARVSREELAKRVGVSIRDVAGWERRFAQPDVEMLENIAQALGADISEVIYGQTEADPKKIKRQWAAFIVFGALFILLLAPSRWFASYAQDIAEKTFQIIPSLIYVSLWTPLLYVLGSLTALNGFSLVWDFRIQTVVARRAVLISSAILLLFFLAAGSLFVLFYLGICDIYGSFWFSFARYIIHSPALLLLPVLGLYLGIKK